MKNISYIETKSIKKCYPSLIGLALEFGFRWSENMELSTSEDELVGCSVKKEFDGEWFRGVVVKAPDASNDKYLVQYEDGDEEKMEEEEVQRLIEGPSSSGPLKTVKHLYGEIEDVKVTKTKVGRSRKITTKALLYVRWDKNIYSDEDEEAEGWLEVIPKFYGMPGKDGWEIVERRPACDEGAVNEMDVDREDDDLDGSDEDEIGNGQESESEVSAVSDVNPIESESEEDEEDKAGYESAEYEQGRESSAGSGQKRKRSTIGS